LIGARWTVPFGCGLSTTYFGDWTPNARTLVRLAGDTVRRNSIFARLAIAGVGDGGGVAGRRSRIYTGRRHHGSRCRRGVCDSNKRRGRGALAGRADVASTKEDGNRRQ